MLKKLCTVLISLGIMFISGCAFAEGTKTEPVLTHFGISVMRDGDKCLSKFLQVNGSLIPSVEKEMIPYSAWQQRAYGYLGIGLTADRPYSFGAGYYLGRVGMVGLQVGFQHDQITNEDDFVYGFYADGNVFKGMIKRIAEIAR